jgi:hypothetical protein
MMMKPLADALTHSHHSLISNTLSIDVFSSSSAGTEAVNAAATVPLRHTTFTASEATLRQGTDPL